MNNVIMDSHNVGIVIMDIVITDIVITDIVIMDIVIMDNNINDLIKIKKQRFLVRIIHLNFDKIEKKNPYRSFLL